MSETQPAIAEKNRIFKITLVISAFLSMIFLDQTGVSVTLTSIQNELALSSSPIKSCASDTIPSQQPRASRHQLSVSVNR